MLLALVVLHYVVVTARQGWFSAESVAVIAMLVMSSGLIYYAEPQDEWFVTYSMVCYAVCILGMIVTALLWKPIKRHPRPIPAALEKPTRTMIVFLFVSALITAAYFIAAGSVPFIAGIQNLLGLGDYDVRDLRLDTYKGERYLAPGYVNQVKNVLLPALAAIAIANLWRLNRVGPRVIAVAMAFGVVVALFGTGQRSFGVVFAITLIGAYALVKGGVNRAVGLRVGLVILLVFTLSTAALGRSAIQAQEVEGVGAVVGVYVGEVFERVFWGQQVAALYAEEVVGNWVITPLSDWWATLAGYLPGQSGGTSIAGEVGRVFYGSDATTVPPSSVTSARLNLSNTGSVIFFFFWGIALAVLSRVLLAVRGGSPLYFLGASGLMITLGTWVVDSPFTTLQSGALMFALLAVIGRRQYTTYLRRLRKSPIPHEVADVTQSGTFQGASAARVRW